jgi:hypothetical protein
MQSVLSSWAQSDPTGAANYVAALPSGKTQEDAVQSIASQLATADVANRLDVGAKASRGTNASERSQSIVAQWSQTDPASAAEFTLRTPAATPSKSSRQHLAPMGSERSSSRAELGADLSDRRRATTSCPTLFPRWRENDPRRAAQMLSRLPMKRRQRRRLPVISQWAASDPEAAGNWAVSFPEGKTRGQIFINLVNRWAGNDPAAAASWLGNLSEGPSRDQAVSAFSNRIGSSDPRPRTMGCNDQ